MEGSFEGENDKKSSGAERGGLRDRIRHIRTSRVSGRDVSPEKPNLTEVRRRGGSNDDGGRREQVSHEQSPDSQVQWVGAQAYLFRAQGGYEICDSNQRIRKQGDGGVAGSRRCNGRDSLGEGNPKIFRCKGFAKVIWAQS